MKGLVLGVANDHSIAWAIAKEILAEGGRIGFTHLPDRPDDERQRNRRRVAQLTDPEPNATFLVPMDVSKDDQIAAVMGHEAGHVVARHAALRAGQQSATQLGVALGGAALGGLPRDQQEMAIGVLGAGATIGILLPFSRNNELEADKLGVDYMHTAGYDVKQSVRLWEKMGAASTDRPTEWMSTHPNPETRIAELRSYITAKGYATF
jgi:hypothetical protein